MQSLEGRCCYC